MGVWKGELSASCDPEIYWGYGGARGAGSRPPWCQGGPSHPWTCAFQVRWGLIHHRVCAELTVPITVLRPPPPRMEHDRDRVQDSSCGCMTPLAANCGSRTLSLGPAPSFCRPRGSLRRSRPTLLPSSLPSWVSDLQQGLLALPACSLLGPSPPTPTAALHISSRLGGSVLRDSN